MTPQVDVASLLAEGEVKARQGVVQDFAAWCLLDSATGTDETIARTSRPQPRAPESRPSRIARIARADRVARRSSAVRPWLVGAGRRVGGAVRAWLRRCA